MRVTHVITRLIVGGAQENTIASVLGLNQIPGVDAQLISGNETGPEGSLAGEFKDSPDRLRFIPELVRAIHPWQDLMARRKLIRLFREQKPDIVHTHSGKAGYLGRLAASKAGVRTIIHTIHGPSFGSFQGALTNQMLLRAERSVGKVTTHFVAVADAMIQQYLWAGIGAPQHYTKIFSGFPLKPFLQSHNHAAIRAKYGLAENDIVIGKIARLFKFKGHEDLFRLAPQLVRANPRIKFLLVGDGPGREKFQREINGLNLPGHFIFTGLVPPSDMPSLIGIMDIVVHLSRREGLARALPQALAAGKPVVAYDCDGANEVCRNDETGFLIPPADLAKLSASLLGLAGNPALREQLGKRGQALVKEKFPVEKMVHDLYALYLRLLSENKMTLP